MKIGSKVKIARDNKKDYGYLLNKIGVIIGGGSKHYGHVRYLIELNNSEVIYAFADDLDIVK